jgi:hypothetical protein
MRAGLVMLAGLCIARRGHTVAPRVIRQFRATAARQIDYS